MTHIPDEAVQAAIEAGDMEGWDHIDGRMRDALTSALPHLSAPCAEKPVDVSEVWRQAFEEGFENGVEQSLDALNAYDDITRNEAEQAIRKLKPDYRALCHEPVSRSAFEQGSSSE